MKNRIKERLWLCAALAALLLAAGCGAQESGGSHLESDDAALDGGGCPLPGTGGGTCGDGFYRGE